MNYYVFGKKIMARQSISEALNGLPDSFIQIQKSYIANFSKIDAIKTDEVIIGIHKIPIGSQFKANLLDKMK